MVGHREGRDVFAHSAAAAPDVAAIFARVFGLPDNQVFFEGQPQEDYLAALARGSSISIFSLDPRGYFRFKIDMEFAGSIAIDLFQAMVAENDIEIAFARDEDIEDFQYFVVTKGGTAIKELSFEDSEASYICNIA